LIFVEDVGLANTRAVRTFPALLGYGAALATTLGGFEYSGGSLFGKKRDPHADEFERREQLRTQRRTPGEQTLVELGEGRGTSLEGIVSHISDSLTNSTL
jgi:hypothetical protein